MMIYILLILVILIILILFLKFSVIISIRKNNIEIKIVFFGIKFKIPIGNKKDVKKAEPSKSNELKDEDSVMKSFMDMRNDFSRTKKAIQAALSYLRYKAEINDMGVLGDFGTGNAATTAIVYGSVQAFLNSVSAFLGQFFKLGKPVRVNIDLNFDKAVFNISFHAILKVRIFNLLIALIIFLKNSKK